MLLRVVDCEYEVVEDGYRERTPIVHLFGRDTSWERHHVSIVGYHPYFLVRTSEWVTKGDSVANDDRVVSVETTDSHGNTERTIGGEALIRVVCREPSDVGDIAELFDDPFEADVDFATRFLLDMAGSQWIDAPIATDGVVDIDTISPVTETPETTPPLRVCTYDIEVAQGGDGPPVVSKEGTERADNPVTAITAHDSYTDEYRVWVTAHPSWDAVAYESITEYESDAPCDVDIYENPHDTVGKFCEWVVTRDFDALTGWNASGFDHPYMFNYGRQNGISSVYDVSPMDTLYDMNGDGNWINSSLKGRLLLDSLTLYEKSKIHELDSYRLSDVAQAEDVSVGKLDLESELPETDDPAIDYAWKNQPELFTEYSLRDVQACVAINAESQRNVTII